MNTKATGTLRRSGWKLDGEKRMVSKIRSDSGQIEDRSNAQPLQLLDGADAGASEDGGTGICPRGEHHLARFDKGSVEEPDPCRAHSLAFDRGDHGVWTDREVLSPSGPSKVRDRRTHPHTVSDGPRRRSNPNCSWFIVVLNAPVPYCGSTVEKRRLDGVQLASRVSTNGNESIRTVPLVGEICVTLQAAESIEDVGEGPAGIAKRNPAVVILRGAPLSEAGVGCRAAPHDSGSGDRDSSVELLIGGVAPIVLDRGLRGIENIGWESGDVRVVGSCLEQNHGAVGVFTQPRGEHAASRSSADDDDVERHEETITDDRHPNCPIRSTYWLMNAIVWSIASGSESSWRLQ